MENSTNRLSSSPKRIMALDVMRGLTIVLMIIVNNAGGPESYQQLQHSEWNGMTLCDLVFPFFLFIMGITTYLSLAKEGFKASSEIIRKILRRTVIILIICWALHWFDNVCDGKGWLDFGQLRLTGVLTRIALCYCIVSIMALYLSRKAMVISAGLLLIAYGWLLLTGNGFTNDLTNINAVIDRAMLPEGHLYVKRPVDPEGLLATISAVAHTIIGFCCGYLLKKKTPLESKLLSLFIFASLMIAGGLLISIFMPLNKRIWSPSYVLVSCGIAAALLSVLSFFIDLKGYRKAFVFFESFGVNPLFLYVLSEALATVIGYSGVKESVYGLLHSLIHDPYLASAAYSIILALVLGIIAYPLYRKKIYIKI